jgi:hypothetical protein|tara:strand:- start:195 stop:743 length:549 start_codon:yes stop_codon:yes gene_type:complete
MNKKVDLNDLKIFNSPDDLAECHYFPKILKRSLEFDLAVHRNLFEDKPHVTDEIDQKWIEWLNRGIFHRAFTRATSLARAENRWYTLKEISTKIFAAPKTVRNIFNECRDLEMIDWRHDGNRLVLQSSERGFRMWKRYTKAMISRIVVEFDDYFRDMQEYQRLKNMVDSTTLNSQKKGEATN